MDAQLERTQQLASRLTELGLADAEDLAQRMVLDIEPHAPMPHAASLLMLAHGLLQAPLGGQDGFGDLTWRIEQGLAPGSLRIEFERDNQPSTVDFAPPFTPANLETTFNDADQDDYTAWDYLQQQFEEDYEDCWKDIAQDCADYLAALAQAEAIREHPRLPEFLLDAVYRGDDAGIADALDLGADPNSVDGQGNGPLHIAARQGLTHLIHPLVQAGVAVNAPNAFGFSPLHLAAQKTRPDTCLALIACNADPRCLDRAGRTPLQLVQGASHEQQQDL